MRRALLLSIVVAAGCGSDDDAPPAEADVVSYELFPSTRTLGAADLALITSLEPGGRIVFASEPPGLAGITERQVFLAGISPSTPQGLLRFVTKVDRTSGFVLETAAAPLQTAFRKLHVKARRKIEPFASPAELRDTSPLVLRPQFTDRVEGKNSYDILVFDGDGDRSTTNDQVRLEASLGGGFDYGIDVDIDWGIVDKLPDTVSSCLEAVAKLLEGEVPSCKPLDLMPEAKATLRADPFLFADAKVSGAASLRFERDIDVAHIALPPFPIGPLVFKPNVDILARIEGGASARFEVAANARAEFASSVVVSSKSPGKPTFNPPTLKKLDASAIPPVLDLHAEAKAGIGARLNLPLYGVAGPYAALSAFTKIEASPLANPCFKVALGIDTELGLRITTPQLPLVGYVVIAEASTGKIDLVQREIASGSCIVPPDPPPPPGGGPAPKTLQSPPFTPWAKALPSEDIDPLPVALFAGVGFPDLVPSIDGRYVLTGDGAFAAHKIDRDGNLTWRARLPRIDRARRRRSTARL